MTPTKKMLSWGKKPLDKLTIVMYNKENEISEVLKYDVHD